MRARIDAACLLFGLVAGCSDATTTPPPPWRNEVWYEMDAGNGPSPRMGHALVFAADRNRLVLFGGYAILTDTESVQPYTYLDDTWEWSGAAWERMQPATKPRGRAGHALAFDSARGRVVLFGGSAGTFQPLGDTWEWDGQDWRQIRPVVSPPPRAAAGLAYDEVRRETILCGGLDDTAPGYRDTWSYDGSTWRRLEASPTPPLDLARLVFDRSAGCILALGECLDDPAQLLHGATFRDGVWTAVPPPVRDTGTRLLGAAPRASFQDVVVLLQPRTEPASSPTTWLWQRGTWRQSAASGPQARIGTTLAGFHNVAVLLGGKESHPAGPPETSLLRDLWIFMTRGSL